MDREQSIIRQVAFKGAIEVVTKAPGEFDEESTVLVVKNLTDRFEAIINQTVE